MDIEGAARSLEKLGHPVRLKIIKLLVQAGPEGLPVGALQKVLDIPASTLSHHISHLMQGDLLTQQREGRTLFCRPNYDRINALVTTLTENCCKGGVLPDLTAGDLESSTV
ncbi:ArsR/SmtB family transcription factor [Coralliovum pocilloporae]|uniref:ArsR/SmtB family transcription factor n=1 Tax=Coralliovum pocilloporae TaxID=3066369 RepID=UPI003306CC2E